MTAHKLMELKNFFEGEIRNLKKDYGSEYRRLAKAIEPIYVELNKMPLERFTVKSKINSTER